MMRSKRALCAVAACMIALSMGFAEEGAPEITAAQGDRVEKGAALMQIAPYDQIYVEIQVAEADIGNAQAGDSVEMIYSADAAEETVSGTIERISRIAENNAYAVLIRPDDAPFLLLGATVSVRLTDA